MRGSVRLVSVYVAPIVSYKVSLDLDTSLLHHKVQSLHRPCRLLQPGERVAEGDELFGRGVLATADHDRESTGREIEDVDGTVLLVMDQECGISLDGRRPLHPVPLDAGWGCQPISADVPHDHGCVDIRAASAAEKPGP